MKSGDDHELDSSCVVLFCTMQIYNCLSLWYENSSGKKKYKIKWIDVINQENSLL